MSCLYSVFDNEFELIKSLIDLHNYGKDIELDPCYSTGNFYKTKLYNEPIYKFDITPITDKVKLADVKCLPFKNNFINSIIFDPPFMFGTHGQTKNNIMNKRFTMFDTFEQLKIMYKEALKEFYRILVKNGVIFFKCQDYTDSKTTMTHCLIWKWAIEQNFYVKDLAILVNKRRIYNPLLKQRHLRKSHCYYWVLQK